MEMKQEKKNMEEDAVVAPVYHRGSAVLTKSNVKNLISHPIGVPIEFKYACCEEFPLSDYSFKT